MENDILEMLQDVCYSGPMLDGKCLEKAIEGGAKSIEFTQLVAWLSQELKSFCKLDEHISEITSPEDSSSFLLELSSFLKELGCVYSTLIEGHVNERLKTRSCRVTLLSYLLSELQAARMVHASKPDPSTAMQIELKETSTANDLKTMLLALKFAKPPDNISPAMLFSKVEIKVKEAVSRAPPDLISKPLFTGNLSDSQWQQLGKLQGDLQKEYFIRRQMLLKRLDVTIQSFLWSDRAKTCQDQITLVYRNRRDLLPESPSVSLSDLLAAREDLAILEKTSCSNVRRNTQSSVNKVIIGMVPDRGGRPSEQRAPPPEMPSWQKERVGGAPTGGGWRGGRGDQGGGGQRGGRGSRVQGGWSQTGMAGGSGFQPMGGQKNEGGYQGGNQANSGYQGVGGGGGYQPRGGQGGGGGYERGRGRGGNRGRGGGRGRGRGQGQNY